MRILPLLPNLKGLSMSVDSSDWYEPRRVPKEETPIQKLLHLETLEIDCSILPRFMNYIGIPHVLSNLRKLCLSSCHLEWWMDHFNFSNLSKLTELTINDFNYGSHKRLRDLLLSLTSPELLKLKIVGQGGRCTNKFDGVGNISSWLRHFLKLNILDLSISYFHWLEGGTGESGETITSLQSLILHDFVGGKKGINLGFLGGFPSLEFLKLIGSPGRDGFEKDVIFNREIWSVKCPKLEEITLVEDNDDEDKCIPVSYSRAKYDYLTRVG